jgi:DNA polymerase/3'-5' exonuclease PolX
MPITTLAVRATAKAIKDLNPDITALHLVGSRLRHKYGRDLDFVAVTSDENRVGMNATMRVGNISVNLFYADKNTVQTSILEFGLGLDIIRWKKAAIKAGYHLNRYGLWKGNVLVSQSMREIAFLIGMSMKPHLVFSLENPY